MGCSGGKHSDKVCGHDQVIVIENVQWECCRCGLDSRETSLLKQSHQCWACGAYLCADCVGKVGSQLLRDRHMYTLQFAEDKVDLFDRGSLLRWIKWADIALLSTAWLIDAPFKEIAARRQDLPVEAFIPESDLEDTPIVILSCAWSSHSNPDTNNAYAKALQNFFYGTEGCKYPKGAALFWDHKSLYQHRMRPQYDGTPDTWEKHLLVPRTPVEEWFFRRAIRGMEGLYFHAEADGLIIRQIPQGALNAQPYICRGWTLMECVGLALHGQARTMDLKGNSKYRPPGECVPMTVPTFEQHLAPRKFACPEDRDVVVASYEVGLNAYTRSSKHLRCNVWGSDKDLCDSLAEVLPKFESLEDLQVNGYPGWDETYPALDAAFDGLVARGCEVLAGEATGGGKGLRPWPHTS